MEITLRKIAKCAFCWEVDENASILHELRDSEKQTKRPTLTISDMNLTFQTMHRRIHEIMIL